MQDVAKLHYAMGAAHAYADASGGLIAALAAQLQGTPSEKLTVILDGLKRYNEAILWTLKREDEENEVYSGY